MGDIPSGDERTHSAPPDKATREKFMLACFLASGQKQAASA
jgi:hypothetical protein